jgi:hypothetical protein
MKLPDLIELKNEIIQLSDVISAAALKSQSPASDEMSTRKAYAEFGKEWIHYHIDKGNVKSIRKGPHKNSKKVFSRLELVALKEAEKRIISHVKRNL